MTNLLFPDLDFRESHGREGDLYKVVHVHGHTFHLYYGYYDERERNNPALEPMPIYPDLAGQPLYTREGCRLVTKMQDACPYYQGKVRIERECAECHYYSHCDDLIGICTCPRNMKTTG